MKTEFREFGATVISQVVLILTAFIVTVIIARQFGPAGAGDYGVIITYIGIINLLGILGIDLVAIHITTARKYDLVQSTMNLLFIALISGLFFFILDTCLFRSHILSKNISFLLGCHLTSW